jgi:hypothetical protein
MADLTACGTVGMIPVKNRAIALGSLSLVESLDSGSLSLTLVSGKEIILEPAEATEFLKIINDTKRQMERAQQQAALAMGNNQLILPRPH